MITALFWAHDDKRRYYNLLSLTYYFNLEKENYDTRRYK